MNITEEEINQFRVYIPRGSMEKAARVYTITRDSKIRENLILQNLDIAIKMVDRLSLNNVDKEDDYQTAYMLLVEAIDNLKLEDKKYIGKIEQIIYRKFIFEKAGRVSKSEAFAPYNLL